MDSKKRIDMEFFIEEIKKYPCLYNKADREFKNTVMKQAIWQSVGSMFSMSGIEAEKKWKVQRDRFNREKKKVEGSKPTGTGAADVYVPTWEQYNLVGSVFTAPNENPNSVSSMSFADFDVTFSSQQTTLQENDTESLLCEEATNDDFATCSFSEVPGEKSSINENLAASCSATPITPSNLRSSKNPKRKREDELLSDLQATTKSINTYFSTPKDKPDMTSAFCLYLEARLRGLKEKRRRRTIYEMEMLIREKELEQEEDGDV